MINLQYDTELKEAKIQLYGMRQLITISKVSKKFKHSLASLRLENNFCFLVETVSEVKHFAAGFIGIGWTLQALNANSELIAQCSKKDFGCLGIDNGAKFEDFLANLYEKNYKLSEDQVNQISKALCLNFSGVSCKLDQLI